VPDVSADRVRGDEAGNLVAPWVVDRMAAVTAIYRCSTFGDIHHPLWERLAPGVAENEARFISWFIIVLYFRG
jgi:hypothetical protein